MPDGVKGGLIVALLVPRLTEPKVDTGGTLRHSIRAERIERAGQIVSCADSLQSLLKARDSLVEILSPHRRVSGGHKKVGTHRRLGYLRVEQLAGIVVFSLRQIHLDYACKTSDVARFRCIKLPKCGFSFRKF